MKLAEAVAKLAEDETLTKQERWKLLMEILKLMQVKLDMVETMRNRARAKMKPPR